MMSITCSKNSPTGRQAGKLLILAFALWAAIFIFPCSGRSAVSSSGYRIAGVVKDALARPIGNAQLVLQSADGHAVARTQSGRNGAFEFPDVPRGTYAVVANKSGS